MLTSPIEKTFDGDGQRDAGKINCVGNRDEVGPSLPHKPRPIAVPIHLKIHPPPKKKNPIAVAGAVDGKSQQKVKQNVLANSHQQICQSNAPKHWARSDSYGYDLMLASRQTLAKSFLVGFAACYVLAQQYHFCSGSPLAHRDAHHLSVGCRRTGLRFVGAQEWS